MNSFTITIKEKRMKKIILLLLITTSMTAVYAEGNHKASGGAHGGGPHWMAPPADAAKQNPVASNPASIDRGKKTYFQNCASCHGAKALGDGPAAATLNPKPSNLRAMSGGHPDGDFAWKIANGRGAMPAWKGALKEDQIWELVNYIQSLNPKGKMMDMSKMDHSNMSKADMAKMMSDMQDKMSMGAGHSNSNGHHDDKPRAESHSNESTHSH